MTSILQEAIYSIICDWEFQRDMCDRSLASSGAWEFQPDVERCDSDGGVYQFHFQQMTALHNALTHLRMAGVVEYTDGKWTIVGDSPYFRQESSGGLFG